MSVADSLHATYRKSEWIMSAVVNAKQSFEFYEIYGGSWLVEELLASYKFLCSMELVTWYVVSYLFS